MMSVWIDGGGSIGEGPLVQAFLALSFVSNYSVVLHFAGAPDRLALPVARPLTSGFSQRPSAGSMVSPTDPNHKAVSG